MLDCRECDHRSTLKVIGPHFQIKLIDKSEICEAWNITRLEELLNEPQWL